MVKIYDTTVIVKAMAYEFGSAAEAVEFKSRVDAGGDPYSMHIYCDAWIFTPLMLANITLSICNELIPLPSMNEDRDLRAKPEWSAISMTSVSRFSKVLLAADLQVQEALRAAGVSQHITYMTRKQQGMMGNCQ